MRIRNLLKLEILDDIQEENVEEESPCEGEAKDDVGSKVGRRERTGDNMKETANEAKW